MTGYLAQEIHRRVYQDRRRPAGQHLPEQGV